MCDEGNVECQNLKNEETADERSTKDHTKKHKCQTCEKLFPSRAHLKEHEVSHTNKQQYQCTVCDQGFKRKNALNKHMRMFHPSRQNSIICSCGKVFASKALMEKHKESSGEHRLLVCGECGALYKSQASLDSHLLLHRENQSTGDSVPWPYTCQTCHEKFSSRASLSNHMKEFHSMDVFQCSECSKTCKTQKLLHFHRLRKHTLGDKFVCQQCNKTFQILKDLRRHMQTHNTLGTRECPVCHTKFKTDSTLRSHMKSHSKGKPFDCSICLFPCSSLTALTTHLQSSHNISDLGSDFSKNWNSKCVVCGQVFLRRSLLAHHMKSHLDSDGTQLLVLEDSNTDDVTKSQLTRQDAYETDQIMKTKTGRKDSVTNKMVTKAEVYSETRKNSLQVDIRGNDQQTSVAEAQTVSISEKISEVSRGKATPVKEKSEDVLSSHDGTSNHWQGSYIQTLDNSAEVVIEGQTNSSTNASDGEETRYICEACSLVLTDMEELKVHLLTCYKEDSNEECFVVFEMDDNKIQ